MSKLSLKLWKYNAVTGYWDYQRSVVVESDAQAWLVVFQRDEPEATFKLARSKPTAKPVLH